MIKRKILAALLSISIVMSSNGIAFAADTNIETTSQAYEITQLTEEQTEESTDVLADEPEGEIPSSEEAASLPEEVESSDETSVQTESDEESGTSTETVEESTDSIEETTQESTVTDEVPEESTEASEEGTEITEESTVIEEETTEEITETETETETLVEEISVFATNKSTFTNDDLKVDEKGVLYNDNAKGDLPYGDVIIPKDAKVIPEDKKLFRMNDGQYETIDTITFEAGSKLETIEAEAFSNCVFKSIALPASLTKIENYAFLAADVTKVTMDEGNKVTIGDNAFAKCTKLTTFTAEGRIKTIGEQAFSGCISLTNILTKDEKNQQVSLLTNVTSIGVEAFEDCKAITAVSIPGTVTTIPQGAFKGCTGLGNGKMYIDADALQIANGVKTVSESAFEGCTGLTIINLPSSVSSVGRNAFKDCKNIDEIYLRNQDGDEQECNVALSYASFPSLFGMKIHAFDGTAEEWVGAHIGAGIIFETLFATHGIKTVAINGKITLTCNNRLKQGEKVTFTLTPNSGYQLKNMSLKYVYTPSDSTSKTVQIDNTYSFKMPDADVTIRAEFEAIDSTNYGSALSAYEPGWKFSNNNNVSYGEGSGGKYYLNMKKTGETAKIKVTGNNGNENFPGTKELNFKSANTKVATISSEGLIKAVGKGSTTITISLINNNHNTEPLTFTCIVAGTAQISTIKTDTGNTEHPKGTLDETSSEATELGMGIFTYSKNIVALSAREITLAIQGYDDTNEKLDVSYNWTTSDSKIAKLASTATSTGKNTITVVKGATGEAVIIAKAKDGSEVTKKYVVRVADTTPRLSETSYTVNPDSTQGTEIQLVSVYNTVIDTDTLEICKKVSRTSETTYEDTDLFGINVTEDGKFYITADDELESNGGITIATGKKYTYIDQYYIRGELQESEQEFFIPIPTLTIYKTAIKPKLTTSGKINLFYNGDATAQEQGAVTVKQSLKDLEVESYRLVGIDKSNGKNTRDDAAFASNFAITEYNQATQTFTITRTDNGMTNYTDGSSKGKPVVKGILRIKYKGFYEAVDTQITVPTYTTAPTFQLSRTSITVNSNAFSTENATVDYTDIQVINKKTKEVLDLQPETKLDFDGSNAGTTNGLVKQDPNQFDAATDTIHVSIIEAKKGKVVYVLTQPTWSTPVKLTLNINKASKDPKVIASKKQLSLNNTCIGMADSMELTLDQRDAVLAQQQTFLPKGKTVNDNLKLTYHYDTASQKGTVTAYATGEVKNGTYSFVCTPNVLYDNATEATTLTKSPVTINVTVQSKQPEIALKNSTFTVNSLYSRQDAITRDIAAQTFTWKNLSSEFAGYALDKTGMTVTCTDKKGDNNAKNQFQITLDETNMKMSLSLKKPVDVNNTYTLSGLKLVKEGSDSIEIKPVTFKVKTISTPYTISVKASGSINPLDDSTCMTYVPTVKNTGGYVTSVSLVELSEYGVQLSDSAVHFTVTHDIATNKTYVRLKDGASVSNRAYKIKLVYRVSTSNVTCTTGDLSIKPAQKMPTLTVSDSAINFYAGNKAYKQSVTITQKKGTTAVITGVKLSTSKNSEEILEAFNAPSYNPTTGLVTISLKNSASLQQNKTYNVVFEIVCDGQLTNTTGTTFTLKTTIKK